MNTLIIIIITGFAYWRIRNLYYNYIALEHRFNLYRLRDKVRRLVIEGKIDSKDVFFDYIDTSICVSIKESDYLNILTIAMLFRKHKDEESIKEFKAEINKSVQGNKYQEEVYIEFAEVLKQYIFKKHYIIKFTLITILKSILVILKIYKKSGKISEAIGSLRIYPETSTASHFYSKIIKAH